MSLPIPVYGQLTRLCPSTPDAYNRNALAGVAELADAMDSKSIGLQGPCGFDSHPRHQTESVFEPTRGGGNVSLWGHSGDIVYTRLRLVARSPEGGRRMVRKKPLRFDLRAFLDRAGAGRNNLVSQVNKTLLSQGDPDYSVLYITNT